VAASAIPFNRVTALAFLDPDVLLRVADTHREQFADGAPFPHVVIDNLFDPTILDAVVAEFPKPQDRTDWIRAKRDTSVKLAMPHDWKLGTTTRLFLNQLNCSAFVQFLERLTGIEGLIPDPHFEGGGLHQIERGGYLKVHADFNMHERLRLDRRLNAIVYLNRGWQEEWGGHLELWDRSMSIAVQKIAPEFNRLVVFATIDWGFHGHPDPLQTPEGVTRRSLATYYYSSGRPADELAAAHDSLYQRRPGERLLRDWIPPAVVDIVKRLRRR
jgi:Rps23 Pro-64 3,4-dihydroxylase Tpa1-like proline 4-hydroxylase